MSTPPQSTSRRLELYLRGDTYGTYEAQQEVIERVRRLVSNPDLDQTVLKDGWRQVHTRGEDRREGALSTYEQFERWAAQNDLSLEPSFQRRTHTSLLTERTYEVAVFPVISLAAYEDDNLRTVIPCTDGDDHYSVHDFLDAAERGKLEEWLGRFDPVEVDPERLLADVAVSA